MGGQWKLEITWKEFWIFFSYFSQRNRMGNAHWDLKKKILKASRIVRLK